LGASGDLGAKLGLDPAWAAQAVRRSGNYAEIFERNVGPKTPLKLERGMNALWNNGGLMYAMPAR
jgi:general L-amino acid transport system substrate-binding protein